MSPFFLITGTFNTIVKDIIRFAFYYYYYNIAVSILEVVNLPLLLLRLLLLPDYQLTDEIRH